MRARQIQRKNKDIKKIKFYLQRQRIKGKKRFDNTHRLHLKIAISIGDLILLFNSIRAINMSSLKKLRFRWLDPYRMHTAYQDKGTYILEDLNGSVFKHTTAGNNLKPFRVRTAYTNTDIGGQGTTTLLRGDEANNNETNQAKNKAAALETERGKVKRENKIFPDKSYIPKNKIFAVIV
jgi:hypothetical protein